MPEKQKFLDDNRYTILKEISEGSMGQSYLCYDHIDNIKVVAKRYAVSPGIIERFKERFEQKKREVSQELSVEEIKTIIRDHFNDAGFIGMQQSPEDRITEIVNEIAQTIKESGGNITESAVNKYTLECFKREAKLLESINHENVVKFLRSFYEGGITAAEPTPYIVTKFIEGETLESKIRKALESKSRREIPVDDIVKYASDIANGLVYLHGGVKKKDGGYISIIHRDLKPENIIITKKGKKEKAIILDMGVAREYLIDRGQTIPAGAPAYAAPEQSKGTAEPKSDVYSLALIMYYALTGINPAKTSEESIIKNIQNMQPRPGDSDLSSNTINNIDNSLCEIIQSAIHENPSKRPTSLQMYNNLQNWLEQRKAQEKQKYQEQGINAKINQLGGQVYEIYKSLQQYTKQYATEHARRIHRTTKQIAENVYTAFNKLPTYQRIVVATALLAALLITGTQTYKAITTMLAGKDGKNSSKITTSSKNQKQGKNLRIYIADGAGPNNRVREEFIQVYGRTPDNVEEIEIQIAGEKIFEKIKEADSSIKNPNRIPKGVYGLSWTSKDNTYLMQKIREAYKRFNLNASKIKKINCPDYNNNGIIGK